MAGTSSPGFHSLDSPRMSWTRWTASTAVHLGLLALVIAVPWTARQAVQMHQVQAVVLVAPAPLKPPPAKLLSKIPPPHIAVQPVIASTPPKPFTPPRLPPLPNVVVHKEVTVAEAPAPAPAPMIAKLDVPQPEIAKPAPPPKPVITGGFGDPNGVAPSPASSRSQMTNLGAFDLSPGSGRGSGTPASGKVVASAGFGNAAAQAGTGGGSNGNGRSVMSDRAIRSAGFADAQSAPASAPLSRPVPAAPVETPVEITFKPKPAYTAEARQQKIEGEVLLEVLFSASGRVEVLRVVRGLGFGLDETARAAAAQIRFQPGTRGGSPVDMKGTVHIVFALS
jgi:TonB family protein